MSDDTSRKRAQAGFEGLLEDFRRDPTGRDAFLTLNGTASWRDPLVEELRALYYGLVGRPEPNNAATGPVEVLALVLASLATANGTVYIDEAVGSWKESSRGFRKLVVDALRSMPPPDPALALRDVLVTCGAHHWRVSDRLERQVRTTVERGWTPDGGERRTAPPFIRAALARMPEPEAPPLEGDPRPSEARETLSDALSEYREFARRAHSLVRVPELDLVLEVPDGVLVRLLASDPGGGPDDLPTASAPFLGAEAWVGGFSPADRHLVVASPGVGKTTLLTWLAHRLAAEAGGRVPVPLLAGQWMDGEPFPAFVERTLLSSGGLSALAGPLAAAMVRGDCVLLLDDLDRLPTDKRGWIMRQLDLVTHGQFSPCPIVVTCRATPGRAEFAGWKRWTIVPLSSADIEVYLQRMVGDACRVQSVLQKVSDLRELAANPRFLALFASAACEDKQTPDDLAAAACQALFLRVPGRFDAELKVRFLLLAAFHAMARGEDALSEEGLRAAFERKLEQEGGLPSTAGDILRELCSDGLMVSLSGSRVRFVCRSLRELLVARLLQSSRPPASRLAYLSGSPRWEKIMRRLAGQSESLVPVGGPAPSEKDVLRVRIWLACSYLSSSWWPGPAQARLSDDALEEWTVALRRSAVFDLDAMTRLFLASTRSRQEVLTCLSIAFHHDRLPRSHSAGAGNPAEMRSSPRHFLELVDTLLSGHDAQATGVQQVPDADPSWEPVKRVLDGLGDAIFEKRPLRECLAVARVLLQAARWLGYEEMFLRVACHPHPTVRTQAVVHTYFLWQVDPEAALGLVARAADQIFGLAGFPRRKELEFVVGSALIIAMAHPERKDAEAALLGLLAMVTRRMGLLLRAVSLVLPEYIERLLRDVPTRWNPANLTEIRTAKRLYAGNRELREAAGEYARFLRTREVDRRRQVELCTWFIEQWPCEILAFGIHQAVQMMAWHTDPDETLRVEMDLAEVALRAGNAHWFGASCDLVRWLDAAPLPMSVSNWERAKRLWTTMVEGRHFKFRGRSGMEYLFSPVLFALAWPRHDEAIPIAWLLDTIDDLIARGDRDGVDAILSGIDVAGAEPGASDETAFHLALDLVEHILARTGLAADSPDALDETRLNDLGAILARMQILRPDVVAVFLADLPQSGLTERLERAMLDREPEESLGSWVGMRSQQFFLHALGTNFWRDFYAEMFESLVNSRSLASTLRHSSRYILDGLSRGHAAWLASPAASTMILASVNEDAK